MNPAKTPELDLVALKRRYMVLVAKIPPQKWHADDALLIAALTKDPSIDIAECIADAHADLPMLGRATRFECGGAPVTRPALYAVDSADDLK